MKKGEIVTNTNGKDKNSMAKKTKKRQITIEFNEEDGAAVLTYYNFIKDHVLAGNKVPERVLNRFVGFFTIEELRIKEEVGFLVNKAKTQTLQRYSKDKEYKFIDFQGLLDFVFNKIEENHFSLKDKSTFIYFVIETIDNYCENKSEMDLILFNTYKRSSICAYITLMFGYSFPGLPKKAPNSEWKNQDLWQAVKHYYSKPKVA